jgi:8-oxo-dGTP diphosphatase
VSILSDAPVLRERPPAPPARAAPLKPGVAFVEVAAAIIRDDSGRYLITRRRPGSHLEGLWEFPGGKREAGESLRACLARELREELGGVFGVGDRVETVRWDYPDKSVVIHFFECRLVSGRVEARESQALEWVPAAALGDYAFPSADQALVERLRSRG